MKLVQVNSSDSSGGAAIAASRLAKALVDMGMDCKFLVNKQIIESNNVICINNTSVSKFISFLKFSFERFYFTRFEKSINERFSFSPANFGYNINNQLLIKNSDIINLHWINFGYLSIKSIKELTKLNKPIVWTMHDMWPFTGGCHHSFECENFTQQCGYCQYLKKPGANDLSHKVFLQKQEIFNDINLHPVAVGSWLGERAQKSNLFKKLKIGVIPNIIDNQIFKPINRHEARKLLQLPDNKKFILFGSIKINDPIKGWKYLSEAINILKNKSLDFQNNVEVILVGKVKGDDSFLNSIPLKINRLGIVSSMETLAMAYSAADLTVVPSLYETFSLVAAESVSCGTPVVAFNNSGPVDIIEHLKTGYLAEFKSSSSLADGIEWALDFKSDAELLHKSISSRFSGEVVASKYIELYRTLLHL